MKDSAKRASCSILMASCLFALGASIGWAKEDPKPSDFDKKVETLIQRSKERQEQAAAEARQRKLRERNAKLQRLGPLIKSIQDEILRKTGQAPHGQCNYRRVSLNSIGEARLLLEDTQEEIGGKDGSGLIGNLEVYKAAHQREQKELRRVADPIIAAGRTTTDEELATIMELKSQAAYHNEIIHSSQKDLKIAIPRREALIFIIEEAAGKDFTPVAGRDFRWERQFCPEFHG